MLRAAAPSHLSRFAVDNAVTLGITPLFFGRRLLALRMSLADRGTEDATLGLNSLNISMNAPAKGKRPVVQNNPSLWQVLFAILILVVSESAWGSTESKMCMFVHLLLCSNAPWLHMNLNNGLCCSGVKTYTLWTFILYVGAWVCVRVREPVLWAMCVQLQRSAKEESIRIWRTVPTGQKSCWAENCEDEKL